MVKDFISLYGFIPLNANLGKIWPRTRFGAVRWVHCSGGGADRGSTSNKLVSLWDNLGHNLPPGGDEMGAQNPKTPRVPRLKWGGIGKILDPPGLTGRVWGWQTHTRRPALSPNPIPNNPM